MRVQLPATEQSFPRRSLRGLYWRGLSATFRVGKAPRSRVYNWFRPRAPWPGHAHSWETLEEYAAWLPRHVRWRPDALNGLIDVFPSRETIAAQFRDKGMFEDDCDGLALFSAQNVAQFADDPDQVYVVTVILDPFTFTRNPLFFSAHVICIFAYDGGWRVISNHELYPERHESFAEAVQHNRYCASHPVLWAEVRDRDLKRLASGSDLERIAASLESRSSTS